MSHETLKHSRWKFHESHAASADGAQCDRCLIVAREYAATMPCLYKPLEAASPPAADIGLEELEQEVRAAAKYAPRKSTGAKYLEWADRLAAIRSRVSGQPGGDARPPASKD